MQYVVCSMWTMYSSSMWTMYSMQYVDDVQCTVCRAFGQYGEDAEHTHIQQSFSFPRSESAQKVRINLLANLWGVGKCDNLKTRKVKHTNPTNAWNLHKRLELISIVTHRKLLVKRLICKCAGILKRLKILRSPGEFHEICWMNLMILENLLMLVISVDLVNLVILVSGDLVYQEHCTIHLYWCWWFWWIHFLYSCSLFHIFVLWTFVFFSIFVILKKHFREMNYMSYLSYVTGTKGESTLYIQHKCVQFFVY